MVVINNQKLSLLSCIYPGDVTLVVRSDVSACLLVVHNRCHQYYWGYYGYCPPPRKATDHSLLERSREWHPKWIVHIIKPLSLKTFGTDTHPASLLYKPWVKLFSDDLENPADDCSDVLQMIGGQRLERKDQTLTCIISVFKILSIKFVTWNICGIGSQAKNK